MSSPLHLHAETPEEKRELARTLAQAAPDVLGDLKLLGTYFGSFESIDLTVEVADAEPV